MTDAPPAIDPDDTGFSIAELDHLLAHRPGPLSQLLGIDRHAPLTGSASLLERGLASIGDDGTLEVQGYAQEIAGILTAAERWTSFSIGPVDARAAGLLVESPAGTVLAHPNPLDVWTFITIDPDAEIDRLVAQTALAYADGGDVEVRTATPEVDRTFTLAREGDDWRFASSATDAETPELSRDHASSDEVAEHLSGFIGAWPNPLEH